MSSSFRREWLANELAKFQSSLARSAPPLDITAPLQALWWAEKGDWERAHTIVMDDESKEAAWVHAYLHRAEGDLGNAHYWYRQAQRPVPTKPLAAEWDSIAESLLTSGAR